MPLSVSPMVLLAFASPSDEQPLRNLPREERAIRAKLEPLIAAGRLESHTLWNTSVDEIVEELRKDRFRNRVRVFHFGGHASASAVMLASDEGTASMGHAVGLADYLGTQAGLVLVVLNGCCTRAQVDAFRRAGVGAVVATTRAIMDDVAADFATHFYAELASSPLKTAFDNASAAVRGKRGQVPRELVCDKELWDEAEWGEEWPWVLLCEPELAHWRLVEADIVEEKVVVKVANEMVDDRGLVDMLATEIGDEEEAKLLLKNVGFPRGRVPWSNNPLVFWSRVMDNLRAGILADGVQRLVDEAAKLYPSNSFFARHATKTR